MSRVRIDNISPSYFPPIHNRYGSTKRLLESTESRNVLVKDMALAMHDTNTRQYIPTGYRHVFVIRHPARVFSSYRNLCLLERSADEKNATNFNLENDSILTDPNTYYSGVHGLWKYVRENLDSNALVLNTDDLLANPGQVLSKFCNQLGLPYRDSLLRWDASTKGLESWQTPADGLFAPGPFHDRTLESSGFGPPTPSVPFDQHPADVQKLTTAALPYFNEMNELRIKTSSP